MDGRAFEACDIHRLLLVCLLEESRVSEIICPSVEGAILLPNVAETETGATAQEEEEVHVDRVKPLSATCTWSGVGSISSNVLPAFVACSCRAQDFHALLQQEPLLKCLYVAACRSRVSETSLRQPLSRAPSLPTLLILVVSITKIRQAVTSLHLS